MKPRRIKLSPEAQKDLFDLYDWLAAEAGPGVAMSYISRIEAHCLGLSHSPERGHKRDDVRRGLRIEGFGKRITIAFVPEADRVTILRIFYAGRDWESDMR